MNNKHLLVKSITLLYHESTLPHRSSVSADLVKNILEHIQLPEVSMGMDMERAVTKALMTTTKRMVDELHSGGIPYSELIQQVMIDCSEDINTIDAIRAGIETKLDEENTQRVCSSIRRTLQQYLRDQQAKKHILEFSNQLRFKPEEITDLPKALFALNNTLEPFYLGGGGDSDPGVVASFGLNDNTALESVYDQVKERSEGLGGLRFGFRDWNRMFGGSIELGKTIVIGALMHQHKTGASLGAFRQLMMYNIPVVKEFVEDSVSNAFVSQTESSKYDPVYIPIFDENDDFICVEQMQFDENDFEHYESGILWRDEIVELPRPKEQAGHGEVSDADELDLERFVYYHDPYTNKQVPVIALKDPFYGKTPKRRPAMLRISTEDEIQDNMEQLYRNTYFSVEKKVPDMSLVSSSEMREYIQYHLGRNGWHAHFMRVNPSEWTYQNVCQAVLDLESKGYDVQVVMVDYLPMIPTTGCTEGPAGYALRDMYRRVRNFMSA